MKKNFKYAILSAIALVGAVSFSACQSSDEIVDSPNNQTGTVKTQISIGLTSKVGNAATRMAYETVQGAQDLDGFRGMEKIKLIPFDKAISLGTESRLGSIIALGDIKGTELTSATETATHTDNGANYLVYEDVAVPQGTSYFLFYGKAPSGTFEKGQLTVSNLDDAANSSATGYTGEFSDPAHVKFTPTSIADPANDATTPAANTNGYYLLGLLNDVASAKAKIGTKKVATAAGESYTDINGTAKTTTAADEVYVDYTGVSSITNWKDVTAAQNNTLYQLFLNFKAMTSYSTFNVQRALEDLYTTLNDIVAIKANGFEVAAAIQAAIIGSGTNANTYNASATPKLTLASAYNGYPSTLNLPDGAARIAWDNTNFCFYDVLKDNKSKSTSFPDNASIATLFSTYSYPADLWYRANTALKASTTKESDNFGNTDNWTTILSTNYSTAANVVSGGTNSVALVEEINYAVGRLDLSVNALTGTATQTNYYDSKGNKFDFAGDFAGGFTLTGVLIGNQKQVGWDFTTTSKGASLGTREFVVYDNTMNSSAGNDPIVAITPTSASGTNYTLVLETTKDAIVNIALEFRNNGEDFYGKDGQLIPKGGTFYMTGQLEPVSTMEKYDEVGGKVFKQDYYTTAKVTIKPGDPTDGDGDGIVDNPEGLQLATNTIPDLRTPQLELCFSVNLTWNKGLTFNLVW